MNLQNKNVILFNAAVGILVVAAVVSTVRSLLVTPEEPSCADRYTNGVAFAITDAGGRPFTGVDLQSRSGVEEWGLVQNVAVVGVKDAPTTHALRYKFAAAATRTEDGGKSRNGAGFHWSPQSYKVRTAGCLTYSIMLPPGFEPGRGVQLPGLASLTGDKAVDAGAAFGELGEIGFERAGQDRAALGQLADMRGDHRIDARLRLVELVHVFAKRAGEVVAAGGKARELSFERVVDAGTCLADLAQVFLDGAAERGAAFGQLLQMLADGALDRRAALGEFLQVHVVPSLSPCPSTRVRRGAAVSPPDVVQMRRNTRGSGEETRGLVDHFIVTICLRAGVDVPQIRHAATSAEFREKCRHI